MSGENNVDFALQIKQSGVLVTQPEQQMQDRGPLAISSRSQSSTYGYLDVTGSNDQNNVELLLNGKSISSQYSGMLSTSDATEADLHSFSPLRIRQGCSKRWCTAAAPALE